MGIMAYSLKWVMQDFVHQPSHSPPQAENRRKTPKLYTRLSFPPLPASDLWPKWKAGTQQQQQNRIRV